MRGAFVLALAIHLCLLLGAGYIYVLPPEKREKLFEMVNIKRPKPAARKVRIAPPKKIRKPVPMRPVRRRTAKPIELIAARTDIVPEFTISLPEPSQAVYAPEVALVRLPEPVVAEAGGGFWGKEIEMKEKEIELESFGLQNLQPVGTVENPVTRLVLRMVHNEAEGGGPGYGEGVVNYRISLVYPEPRFIIMVTGKVLDSRQVSLGPYAVPPEEFIWSVESIGPATNAGGILRLSTDPVYCDIRKVGPNTIQYGFEDWGDWDVPGHVGDLRFQVTFLGGG